MSKFNRPFCLVNIAVSTFLLTSFSVAAAENCDLSSPFPASFCQVVNVDVLALGINQSESPEPFAELTLATAQTNCTGGIVKFSPDSFGVSAFSILQKAKAGGLKVSLLYDKTEPSSGVVDCELKYISF